MPQPPPPPPPPPASGEPEGQKSRVQVMAENIELKNQLKEAHDAIDALKKAVTDGTVHVWNPKEKPKSLAELAMDPNKAKAAAALAVKEEMDALKTELEAAKKREKALEKENKKLKEHETKFKKVISELNSELEVLSSQGGGGGGGGEGVPESEVRRRIEESVFTAEQKIEEEALQMQLELQEDIDRKVQKITELEKEVAEARQQAAEAKAKHQDQLQQQQQQQQATPPRAPSAGTAAASSSSPAGGGSDAATVAELRGEVERAVAKQKIAEAVKTQAIQAASELKATVARQDNEIQRLKRALQSGGGGGRLGGADDHNIQEKLRFDQETVAAATAAATAASKSAASSHATIEDAERTIQQLHETIADQRVTLDTLNEEWQVRFNKEIADLRIQFSAKNTDLEVELDRVKKELTEAKRAAHLAKLEKDKAVEASKKLLMEGGSSTAMRAEMITQLQETIAQQKIQLETYEQDASGRMRADQAAEHQRHLDTERALQRELQSAKETIERLRLDFQLLQKERDKAMEVGKKSLDERNMAIEAAAKQQQRMSVAEEEKHIARLQQQTAEKDFDKVKKCFNFAMEKFQHISDKIDAATNPEEVQAVIHDTLFDYERRIWDLNNQLKSMTTIVEMRTDDVTSEKDKVIRALSEENDTLRYIQQSQKQEFEQQAKTWQERITQYAEYAARAGSTPQTAGAQHHADAQHLPNPYPSPHQQQQRPGVAAQPVGASPPPRNPYK